jgi:hypothetical protein
MTELRAEDRDPPSLAFLEHRCVELGIAVMLSDERGELGFNLPDRHVSPHDAALVMRLQDDAVHVGASKLLYQLL